MCTRGPLAPPLRRGSLRRECGTQLKLLGFSFPRGESKFSFEEEEAGVRVGIRVDGGRRLAAVFLQI